VVEEMRPEFILQFVENHLLTISLGTFIASTLVFHMLLVWRKLKRKLFWIIIDYIWIVTSAVAIFLGISKYEMDAKEGEMKAQYRLAENTMTGIAQYLEASYIRFCEPLDLDAFHIEEDKKLQERMRIDFHCQYLSNMVLQRGRAKWDLMQPQNYPLKELDIDPSYGNISYTRDKLSKIEYYIKKDRQRLNNYLFDWNWRVQFLNQAYQNAIKFRPMYFISRFWSILLGLSIALRLTRVSADIKTEKLTNKVVLGVRGASGGKHTIAAWPKSLLLYQDHGGCVTHGKSMPVSKKV
jgi:hypothetical protein